MIWLRIMLEAGFHACSFAGVIGLFIAGEVFGLTSNIAWEGKD